MQEFLTDPFSTVNLTLLVVVAGLLMFTVQGGEPRVRLVASYVCIALTCRYLFWRMTDTLPSDPSLVQSWLGWLLFAAELLSNIAGLIGIQALSRSMVRSAEVEAHPLESWPAPLPHIAILIPTYNEGEAILRRTIIGASHQDYANVSVWVLDDQRRPWLRDMAESLGVNYLTRPDNTHAKAGNMNHALAFLRQSAEPPQFVAVLDADFVPTPWFLPRTLALMHAPDVGIVQTPQVFFNPDPFQMNLQSDKLPDEQRYYFDVICPSRDAHGTVTSCGTSSLVRVSMLEAVGDFPTESVTEDILLSIKSACQGWRTVFLHEPLTSGLAPEGLAEFLTQRGRWCLGHMQILRSKWGPLGSAPIPWRLRLHSFDIMLNWIVGPVLGLICLMMPILYWWFGVSVMHVDFDAAVSFVLPYWISTTLFYIWLGRGTYLPFLKDAIQLVMMFSTMRAVFIGLVGRRSQKFKVTDKGRLSNQAEPNWGLLRWLAPIFVASAGGMLWRTLWPPMMAQEANSDMLNLFWTVYNLICLGLAGLICVEQPRRRREERFEVDEPVTLALDGQVLLARLQDISLGGCAVQMAVPLPTPLRQGSTLRLWIEDVGALHASVMSSGHDRLRLRFELVDEQLAMLQRRIFSGDAIKPMHQANIADVATAVWRMLIKR
jgi:cellulose synthase (UDP-forming)